MPSPLVTPLPSPSPLPTAVPFGRTARRLEWVHLPPAVRTLVESRIGSPVVSAASQGGGFAAGFASVLTTEAGTRHFVKAASIKAQRGFAAAYREEASVLTALPAGVPAPRLRWVTEVADWRVLEIEHIDARLPRRPWRQVDLDAALDALEVVAEQLTPAPAAMAAPTFAEEYAALPGLWAEVLSWSLPLDGLATHGAEAAELAAGFAPLTLGSTLVHNDLRDDHVLLTPGGTAEVCGWTFPCVGADWIDTLTLLIGPRGDGLDADALLAARPLTREVPAAAVDAVLALLTGWFLRQGAQAAPTMSPHLRDFQRWQGAVTWDWLAERRGWRSI